MSGASCQHCLVRRADLDHNLLKCSRCLFATYCSSECQTNNWSSHKTTCKEIVANSRWMDENSMTDHLSSVCATHGLDFIDSYARSELELAANLAFAISTPGSQLKSTHVMWLEFNFVPGKRSILHQFKLVDGGLEAHEPFIKRHWSWTRGPNDPLEGRDPILLRTMKQEDMIKSSPGLKAQCRAPDDGVVLVVARFRHEGSLNGSTHTNGFFVSRISTPVQRMANEEPLKCPLIPVSDWMGYLRRSLASAKQVRTNLDAQVEWMRECVEGRHPEVVLTAAVKAKIRREVDNWDEQSRQEAEDVERKKKAKKDAKKARVQA